MYFMNGLQLIFTALFMIILENKFIDSLTPHSTGRRFRYADDDLGFSLKLFQIAAKA